jgi:hypothetical protein
MTCWTIDTESCRIKVEMILELRSAGDGALADQVTSIGKDCSGEAKFANKYGLGAFRDHRKLLEQAEQDAADEARDDKDALTTFLAKEICKMQKRNWLSK